MSLFICFSFCETYCTLSIKFMQIYPGAPFILEIFSRKVEDIRLGEIEHSTG